MDLRESECATEIELKSASILCHCIVRDDFESRQLKREPNKTKKTYYLKLLRMPNYNYNLTIVRF
jgi:hypothetical protein